MDEPDQIIEDQIEFIPYEEARSLREENRRLRMHIDFLEEKIDRIGVRKEDVLRVLDTNSSYRSYPPATVYPTLNNPFGGYSGSASQLQNQIQSLNTKNATMKKKRLP
jgi:hypothetical protein